MYWGGENWGGMDIWSAKKKEEKNHIIKGRSVSFCREFDVIGVKSEGRGSKTCERFVTHNSQLVNDLEIRRRHARKLLFSSLNFSQSSRMYTVVVLSDDSDHVSVEESLSEVYNSVDILFSSHAESYVYSKFFNTGSIRVES